MIGKLENILFILTLSALLVVESSTSSPIESEQMADLIGRLDLLQTEVNAARTENDKLSARFGDLLAENAELKSDVTGLKVQVSKQDYEIILLKNHVSNLESAQPFKKNFYENGMMKNGVSVVEGNSSPPSSCKDLTVGDYNLYLWNGIYLIKNKTTKKIQAVFCQFSNGNKDVSEQLIGNVDIKTKSVHFYVQKSISFNKANAIIPFEVERLNVGGAMNLTFGIFTAPVAGIYHFEFSAQDDASINTGSDTVGYWDIDFQVNGSNIGIIGTSKKGDYESSSLTASLRLKANDRVNLYKNSNGAAAIYESLDGHHTHFTGWLVEEDLL